ncbi:MAG: aspartate kinase [Deltaproteobacteria bacterium]|nr:MAG: aspartate kinase [Deltaproteobacteria bacterium]
MAQPQRIVQKYGGTSLAGADRIRAVADRVAVTRRDGHEVVVVVSAMAGETDRLLQLAAEIADRPSDRELDVLLATGEQVTSALLSMALHERGIDAVSLQGHQIRIQTDSSYGRARIRSIDVSRVEQALAEGHVVVVPGFQGVDEKHNITTLGRGGSDTTAVALAAALSAAYCEIYTDVDGVYTTDPRICPDAVKLERICYDEMLELASLGAKVLQIRSVECASRYQVPVHVRSSFHRGDGTWVVPEDQIMEEMLVSGVAYDKDQAKVTLQGVPDRPGLAAAVFGPLAEEGIVIDMIVQNVSADGRTDLTFTVAKKDLARVEKSISSLASNIGARGVIVGAEVGKVSVVGLGMRNHAGVAARMFEILAAKQINIQMISTSEIKISVVVDVDQVDTAVRALHAEFIDAESTDNETAERGA